jgi:hypothetical protein
MPSYANLTVAQLKKQLTARGLATEGRKALLVGRLEEADTKVQESSKPATNLESNDSTTFELPSAPTPAYPSSSDDHTVPGGDDSNTSRKNQTSPDINSPENKIRPKASAISGSLLSGEISEAESHVNSSSAEKSVALPSTESAPTDTSASSSSNSTTATATATATATTTDAVVLPEELRSAVKLFVGQIPHVTKSDDRQPSFQA